MERRGLTTGRAIAIVAVLVAGALAIWMTARGDRDDRPQVDFGFDTSTSAALDKLEAAEQQTIAKMRAMPTPGCARFAAATAPAGCPDDRARANLADATEAALAMLPPVKDFDGACAAAADLIAPERAQLGCK
jgi:hypothetical protein